MNTAAQIGGSAPQLTPLAAHLGIPPVASVNYQGALSARVFSTLSEELQALTAGAGIYDLGFQSYLRVNGGDRLRWLNGMVTNTIQGLPQGHWNASFLLNAQGRIQGDANIYRTPESLILQTSRAQIERLTAHLDHFIIMDDVELQSLDEGQTSLGIAGPHASEILSSLGFPLPEASTFLSTQINGAGFTVVHAYSPLVPRFEIWLPVSALPSLWTTLTEKGAVPCGVTALEALRVLEGTPLYGVDIHEKHLAQETSQMRMLNFNKGCYLGQEIVERIRSRATVHRFIRQFSVENAPESLEPGQTVEIHAEGAERNPVGEITSLAHFELPFFTGALALGTIRTEALERKLKLSHSEGSVAVLDGPPKLTHG